MPCYANVNSSRNYIIMYYDNYELILDVMFFTMSYLAQVRSFVETTIDVSFWTVKISLYYTQLNIMRYAIYALHSIEI